MDSEIILNLDGNEGNDTSAVKTKRRAAAGTRVRISFMSFRLGLMGRPESRTHS